MKLEITFPHPDSKLGLNGSLPTDPRAASARNRARIGLKMKTRNAAYLRALAALKDVPQRNFPARQVDVCWVYKGMRPDVDGVVTRLKPLIDGCAKAFGINDRDLELGRVRRVHSLGNDAGSVILTFDTEPLI